MACDFQNQVGHIRENNGNYLLNYIKNSRIVNNLIYVLWLKNFEQRSSLFHISNSLMFASLILYM